MAVVFSIQTANKVRRQYAATSSQTGAFVIEDRTNYLISLPASAVASGTQIEQVHQYLPNRVATATSGTSGDPATVFRQEATTNLASWGRAWSNSIITPARLVIDLGVAIDIRSVQYFGPTSTGYVEQSSGARGVTLRFGTSALSTTYNDTTNAAKSFTTEWINGHNTTLNTAGPEGMTGSVNTFSLNGNAVLSARYVAFDVATSWDQYNLNIQRIRFREMAIQVDMGTTLTLDTVGPSVEQFSITDANGNFNEGSSISVVVGVDTVRLSKPGRYDFLRVGSKFHVFNDGRKVGEASI